MLFTRAFERVQLHGLAEVAVGLQLIAFHDVRFRLGRGQDDRRDRLQAVISLDVGQNLAAVHPGEIQVQQDQVRTRGIGVGAFVPQKGHGLHAVGSHVQADRPVGLAERFLRQPDVTGTVFDQENFYGIQRLRCLS